MIDRTTGARRLLNQQLAHRTCSSPSALVSFMGALQAQDDAAALWAVGARLPATKQTAITAALDDGQLVRTHALRGTWHLVAAEDVRWMTRLVGARVAGAAARRHRELGLDAGTLKSARAALETALRDGAALTRAEIATVARSPRAAGARAHPRRSRR